MKNIMQAVKFIFFIWITTCGFIQLKAQEKHFIYIQNESKQPFYVQLNKEIYSSTPGGFLIISQLVSGKYNLVTGFAKNQYPEQKFEIELNNQDLGYSLKQHDDKGWELFDLLNFNTILSNKKDTVSFNNSITDTQKQTIAAPAKDSIMALNSAVVVALDSTYNPLPKTDAKKDSSAIVSQVNNNVPEDIHKEKGIVKSGSSIEKTFERPGDNGLDQIYVDKSGSKHDTIALFIPRIEKNSIPAVPLKVKEPMITESNKIKKCTGVATDEDFYKTRLSIAAATTENAMMLAAKAAFQIKCYSTRQVKFLDVLFLSEESRLRFLALAHPYVYDPVNYPSLQSQFSEPAMIQRFKALLKKY